MLRLPYVINSIRWHIIKISLIVTLFSLQHKDVANSLYALVRSVLGFTYVKIRFFELPAITKPDPTDT